MLLTGRGPDEVVAIACNQDALVLLGGREDAIVGRIWHEYFAQLNDVVPVTLECTTDRGGNVVVEEELHFAACSIWGRARRSISAR